MEGRSERRVERKVPCDVEQDNLSSFCINKSGLQSQMEVNFICCRATVLNRRGYVRGSVFAETATTGGTRPPNDLGSVTVFH